VVVVAEGANFKIVFATAAMIALYALIVGRCLPKS
jgi:hypothetical protein